MRRLLFPIAILIAAFAVPTAAGALTVGVSDQQASTFSNPLFKPLKFKAARYITPYDVMESPNDKAALDAWVAGARAQHQVPYCMGSGWSTREDAMSSRPH